MIDLQKHMHLAKEVSKLAGASLLSRMSETKEVIASSGRDIKLRIDIETEELIKNYLLEHQSYPILGEETGLTGDLGDIFWVIDPLDGTSNYFRDIPISCVSIALVSSLEPVLGAIYDFNHDDLYSGSQQESATLNGKKISVSLGIKRSESTIMTGIPAKTNYADEEFETMIEEFQNWKKVRMIGSAAMASVYVAAGRAEAYQEKGIFLWDIAAGAAIVRAAGGKINITDMQSDFRVNARFTNAMIEA